MKSKEELEALRQEYKELNKKLSELSNEELENITGGNRESICIICRKPFIVSGDVYDYRFLCPDCSHGRRIIRP